MQHIHQKNLGLSKCDISKFISNINVVVRRQPLCLYNHVGGFNFFKKVVISIDIIYQDHQHLDTYLAV